MAGAFLDASVLRNKDRTEAVRYDVQQNKIRFEFPQGFSDIPLIEECRALNALDMENPDNFDFMFDITMQLLSGKVVFIYYVDTKDIKHELARFVVNDRYMNLRGVDAIDEYPILVNWLVEFIAGMLGKKFPRSLQSIQAKMSEKEERMKSLSQKKNQKVS